MGTSGSGKSTVGLRLATALGVPHVELDALFWLPGWVEPEAEDFRGRVREATEADSWVASCNYMTKAQHLLWDHAEMILWLDLPLHVTIPRQLIRSWRRWRTRELLWGTNLERFWPQLAFWDAKRSLVGFALSARPRQRRALADAMVDPQWARLRFVRLTSQREVDRFVTSIIAEHTEEIA